MSWPILYYAYDKTAKTWPKYLQKQKSELHSDFRIRLNSDSLRQNISLCRSPYVSGSPCCRTDVRSTSGYSQHPYASIFYERFLFANNIQYIHRSQLRVVQTRRRHKPLTPRVYEVYDTTPRDYHSGEPQGGDSSLPKHDFPPPRTKWCSHNTDE